MMDAVLPSLRQGSFAEPIETARAWLDRTEHVALATVIATWGSAPVPVGSRLVVAPDQEFRGSVSGGCVETEVITEAGEILQDGRPRVLTYGVSDETALAAGLPCGGTIEIFLERLDHGDSPYLDTLLDEREARHPLIVRTRLADGVRTIITNEEEGGEIEAALSSGESRIIDTVDGRFFLHALVPAIRLIIVGATHIAQILAQMAAELGYRIVIVDPRSGFNTAERFGDMPRAVEWPESGLADIGIDPWTAIVVVSHVAAIDDEALSAALKSPAFYIGALGSRRNHAARSSRLAAAGFDAAALARIHAPIGLAIGARGAAEIAISILAELIKERRT